MFNDRKNMVVASVIIQVHGKSHFGQQACVAMAEGRPVIRKPNDQSGGIRLQVCPGSI